MTNTSDNNADKTPAAKPTKPKGPIRFEVLVPIAVVLALTFLYFSTYFDRHLKLALEWAATQANGAEVNVDSVKTSFLTPSFSIFNIQITDKNKPQRNLFQVNEIRLRFLWDALLRAKFVVDESSILNIQALTPRKKPGFVVPPSPKKESQLEKVEAAVLAQTKAEFDGNVLGDLAHLLDGVKPEEQLKNIEAELKSSGFLRDLDRELKEKEVLWKTRLKELPQKEEIDAIGKRIKALKFDGKDPQVFAASLKEADSLIKEVQAKIKFVDQTGKDLNGDLRKYQETFKQLEEMIQQDLKDLQARLKIPSIDPKDLSLKIFSKMFQGKIVELRKYMELGREYMPPLKARGGENEQPPMIPPARGQGKTYAFPITKGYPLFWLKKAVISSEPTDSEYSGRLRGTITNLSTSPATIGIPLVAEISGDFPKSQIHGFDARLTVDHITESPKESVVLTVASYPFQGLEISKSDTLNFGLTQGIGTARVEATLEQQNLKIDMQNTLKQIQYQIDARSNLIKEILTKVMAGIPVIEVNARASGAWTNMNFSLNSNLGEELAKGFRAQLQAKINEAKEKINSLVNEKVGAQKQKLTQEFEKLKGQVTAQIDRVKGEVEKAKKQAEQDIKSEQSKAKQGELKKLEDEGKKLLKKFKF